MFTSFPLCWLSGLSHTSCCLDIRLLAHCVSIFVAYLVFVLLFFVSGLFDPDWIHLRCSLCFKKLCSQVVQSPLSVYSSLSSIWSCEDLSFEIDSETLFNETPDAERAPFHVHDLELYRSSPVRPPVEDDFFFVRESVSSLPSALRTVPVSNLGRRGLWLANSGLHTWSYAPLSREILPLIQRFLPSWLPVSLRRSNPRRTPTVFLYVSSLAADVTLVSLGVLALHLATFRLSFVAILAHSVDFHDSTGTRLRSF